MLTGAQIRAARAALGWSANYLAAKAGIALKTINRFEKVNGVPPSRSQTLIQIQNVLEAAGIEFTGTPEEGPGIRIWAKEATSRPKGSSKD
jgi:transcriptional regulator with XRE-family HTH domain